MNDLVEKDFCFGLRIRKIAIPHIEFLGLWESLHNQDFNPLEIEGVRGEAGLHAFTMSPSAR